MCLWCNRRMNRHPPRSERIGTDGRDEPHAFMAWNEGKGRIHRPVAARGVKIRVARTGASSIVSGLPKACTTAAFKFKK